MSRTRVRRWSRVAATFGLVVVFATSALPDKTRAEEVEEDTAATKVDFFTVARGEDQ